MSSSKEYDLNTLLHRPTILVVDDEPDIFYLLGNILRKINIDFVRAGSIRDALDIIRRMPSISLVFLDNHLPDGEGVEYIENFKENDNRAVVMMTAYDTLYDRKKAEKNGADAFIGKPFTKEQITNIIKKILLTRAY